MKVEDSDSKAAYSAPALEKGLDIVELLAERQKPMTARDIASALGRSKNEIFRMVYVLMNRGYLNRDPASDRLSLSNKLFEIGIRTPQSMQLLEAALPAMEDLANEIGKSAHLVVVNNGETVVVATAVGGAEVSFSLRLGYRRPAIEAASGLTVMAFQTAENRRQMLSAAAARSSGSLNPVELDDLLDEIAEAGSYMTESHHFVGVTDICAPIIDRNGSAIASIVIPCWRKVSGNDDFGVVRDQLLNTCRNISNALLQSS